MSWLGTWLGVVERRDAAAAAHAAPARRPQATRASGPPWKGKTFVVTGPTSGIGTTTAETLARLGAQRDPGVPDRDQRGEALVEAVGARATPEPGQYGRGVECEVMHLDLDSLRFGPRVRRARSTRERSPAALPGEQRRACSTCPARIRNTSRTGTSSTTGPTTSRPRLLSLLLLPSLKRAGASLREFDEAFSYTSYGRSHDSGRARIVFVCSKLHEFCDGRRDLEDRERSSAGGTARARRTRRASSRSFCSFASSNGGWA